MPSAALKVGHPYVTTKKGICQGKPTLVGNRIPVWAIAGWYKKGSSAEQIQHNVYSSLGLAEIYDALSYYHNREEVDHQVEENSLSSREVKKRQARWGAAHSERWPSYPS